MPYDPFARDSIPVADLQACLKAQGTEVKFGDILITRTGISPSSLSLSLLSSFFSPSPNPLSLTPHLTST